MRLVAALITALVLSFGLSALAESFPDVDVQIANYESAVASMDAEFAETPADSSSVVWVQSKLAHMFKIDQYMRYFWIDHLKELDGAKLEYFKLAFIPRFKEMDRRCTADIQELLKIYNWFTISTFGAAADNQAWLVVQHADLQPEFQKMVLARLEKLYPIGETKPSNYAYLYDRVATNAPTPGQLQRYGTQGRCVGPALWEPNPIENPEKVDERRASVGLGTMAEYKKLFTHCK